MEEMSKGKERTEGKEIGKVEVTRKIRIGRLLLKAIIKTLSYPDLRCYELFFNVWVF